jgi:hypothetical protein
LIIFCYIFQGEAGMALNKNKNEDQKRQRFIRIAERRVNNILSNIDSLGNCANKRNYKYNDEDVVKIFKAIDEKLKTVRFLFSNPEKSKSYFSLK